MRKRELEWEQSRHADRLFDIDRYIAVADPAIIGEKGRSAPHTPFAENCAPRELKLVHLLKFTKLLNRAARPSLEILFAHHPPISSTQQNLNPPLVRYIYNYCAQPFSQSWLVARFLDSQPYLNLS